MRENRTYGLTRDRRPKVRTSATGTTHSDGQVGTEEEPESRRDSLARMDAKNSRQP